MSSDGRARRESGRASRAWKHVKEHPDDVVTACILLVVFGAGIADIFLELLPERWIGGATLSTVSVIGLMALHLRRASQNGDRSFEAISNDLRTVSANVAALVDSRDIVEIPGEQIGTSLEGILQSAGSWKFKGGAGRWQRVSVMPTLARIKTKDVDYELHLVDPSDEELCKRYDRYRAAQRADSVKRKDEKIREEILACIYAAGWYSHRSRLRPSITLTRTYSPLRTDVGDDALVVSVADRTQPGLLVRRGAWLYESMSDELDRAINEAPRLVLPDAGADVFPELKEEVTAAHVKKFLDCVLVVDPVDGAQPKKFVVGEWSEDVDLNRVAAIAFPEEWN